MSLETFTEHPNYFLSDGDTVLLVENVLFCVHSYFLRRESETFARLLAIDDSDPDTSHRIPGNELDEGVTIERLSEAHSKSILDKEDAHTTNIKRGFKLDGYTSTALSNLLWMFYNSEYDFTPQSGGTTPEMATHRWLSILTSSILFSMPKLTNIACKSLSTLSHAMDPIAKIQLSRVYKLDREWAKDAWMALCTREGSIVTWEAAKLGMEDVIRVIGAREKVIQRKVQYGTNIDEGWLMEALFPPLRPLTAPRTPPPVDIPDEDSPMKKYKKKGKMANRKRM